MVLEPVPDSREMLNQRDSKAPQFGLVADARLHEDLRRVYRAKRQNHLPRCMNATRASSIGNLHAGGSVVLESQPSDQRVGEHGEIWLIHVRENIRTEDGLPFSIANAPVGNGCAAIGLHDSSVLILEDRNPKRPYSAKQGLNGWGWIALQRLNQYRSAGSAVCWIRCPLPILDAAINIKYRFIAPRWVPRF